MKRIGWDWIRMLGIWVLEMKRYDCDGLGCISEKKERLEKEQIRKAS